MRQVGAQPAHCLDVVDAVACVLFEPGSHGENVRIEDDVLGRETDSLREELVGAPADLGAALEAVGLPLLVEGHHHHRGAVLAAKARLAQELRLALLHRYRVDDRLALHALEAGLDHAPFRAVDHERHARDVGLGSGEAQEGGHRFFRVEHRFVHVDVDHLRAVLDLLARDAERPRIVAGEDQTRECPRARDVGAFADVDEQRLVSDVERLEAREAQRARARGNRPRGDAADGVGHRADMLRRGAAAAADDVEPAASRPFADMCRHRLGRVVVLAEGVRQSGVRMARDARLGDRGQLFDIGPQLLGAEGAIEAHGDRLGVPHRVVERLGGLAGKGAPRGVGDRSGDHYRDAQAVALESLLDRDQGRLGVQRVEHRLDEEQVDATLEQAFHRLAVSGDQLVEGHGAKARVVDVGRNRRGFVRRTEHARDEAGALRIFGLGLPHGVPGEIRRRAVELAGELAHAVIGQRNGGRVESIRLDDVGARLQVLRVDIAHQRRLGQRQQVVVAFELAAPVAKALAAIVLFGEPGALDHGAHCAVEQKDALGEQGFQPGSVRRNAHAAPEKRKARSAFAETGPISDAARLFSGICSAPAS